MPEGQKSIDRLLKIRPSWPERTRTRLLFGLLLMVLGFIGFAWITREQIARDIISDEFARLDIPASYAIRSIGPSEQVLSDVVMGDPERPDFTADKVIVRLSYGLGTPEIGRIILVNPRLYGSFRDGVLSFGTLDKAIYAPSEEPPGLPDFVLEMFDGRALIETDFGAIGIKAEGKGNLASGFSGTLAASAPGLSDGSCSVARLSMFGRISSDQGLPAFNGPIRMRELSCPSQAIKVKSADWQVELTGESDFSGFDAAGALAASALTSPAIVGNALAGTVRLNGTGDGLRSQFDLRADRVSAQPIELASLKLEGDVRSPTDLSAFDGDFELSAVDVGLSGSARATLGRSNHSTGVALLDQLAARMERGLARIQQGNSLRANVNLRQNDGGTALVVPQALLRDSSGASLVSLSRVQVRYSDRLAWPIVTGNAALSGRDLPDLTLRMEQSATGDPVMRLRMAGYAAEDSSINIPDLAIAQDDKGMLRFSGRAVLSGPISSSDVLEDLAVPLDGRWSAQEGLVLIERCSSLSARRAGFAGISLDRPAITLCPGPTRAGIRLRNNELLSDLTLQPAELSGRYNGERAALSTGSVSFSTASGLMARDLRLELGDGEGASRFAFAHVSASLDRYWSGAFDGADLALGVVPLDISDGAGEWRFEDGTLMLQRGSLSLSDRETEPRFESLIARDAALTLEDGVIAAEADLREPFSDRVVTRVLVEHELSSGEGTANLLVRDLLFDEALQPAAGSDVCFSRAARPQGFRPQTPGLSCLALGIIANVEGTVSGEGQIGWDAETITSSGAFSTQDANLAAAFGPLAGVSGTVRFTDLLDLTTAPGQTFTIDSINPGVEVFDGTVAFNLRDGQVLEIEGGTWPFMGGELALEPAVLDFRQPMERRYVLLINGLDAARFVEQMDLANIGATGVFDGAVPIVFDTDGNGRIEEGLLTSRPPGGNVSYIGELTYEDLGAMANFAFQSLRSLDFTTMEVEMNGPLTGEIITRLKFDGVRQGEGASSNLVTRQIAKLPIQFRVNIRADFYSLLTNLQSIYDPAFVRDPRDLGLLESDGSRFVVPKPPEMPATKPEDIDNSDISDEPAIQPQESETMQ